jgi:mannose-6-phosphate isomerase-like protein (cupin superfamily)
MPQQLLIVLRDSVLPMADDLKREKILAPGEAGKKSFGSFPPARGSGSAHISAPALAFPYRGHSTLELAFGLQGRAEFALDGRLYSLEAGDLAVVPPDVPH